MKNTNKQTSKTTASTKSARSKSTNERPILGKCSTSSWFRAKHTRPKTVVVTLERTNAGYTVIEGAIIRNKNQYTGDMIQADARELVRDINRRGLIAR